MKKHRLAIKISVPALLLFAAVLTSPMWLVRWSTTVAAATSSGQLAPIVPHQMRDTPHMHVKNWLLQPTGSTSPDVRPLDPNTVPKFVNQLSIPPVFVPVGTKFDPSIGRDVPLYEVTENTVFQQILPSGFPKTKIYGYGGKVNTAKPGQPQNIQTVFSTPGPTFEATANRRIFVHYINNLDGAHMFPVDPTIIAANPNNAPIPTAPFKPFPGGYPEFQSPIVTVAHLHGGVTPSDSDGFPESC